MSAQLALEGAALDHAELLMAGAYAPLTGFMTAADVAAVRDTGRLADGTPWPVPITLPGGASAGDKVELTDPEGAPVAVLTVQERWNDGGRPMLGGPLTPLRPISYGPFRALRRSPAEVRPLLAPGTTAVLADRPPRPGELPARPLLVLVPATSAALVRAARVAVEELETPTELVVVPLPDPRLAEVVAKNYGATELLRLPDRGSSGDSGRGVVVFFTGLSGSGKSTIARGLADRLHDRGRTVTMLDGDVVRRLLSKGLTFSREDREENIRRIGFVAAEVARHGGLAICAPIAPYAATRAEVREMVRAAGGELLLIHVATPLEVCEARDRKGLYAQARAGLISEFTGISDPYEEPTDADLVLDTSGMTEGEAVDAVLTRLS